MNQVRRDVAKLGKVWPPELEWYARAVSTLQAKSPVDRTSWRYIAGIHGFDRTTWLDNGIISELDTLPSEAERDQRMWNQCQHQGWYFLPWHRAYLKAFEDIIATTIGDLGGPSDWKLPYWNYFDESDPVARRYPTAFLEPALPDGSANPLSNPPRGPAQMLGPSAWFPGDIDLTAMRVRQFTSANRGLGFGGGRTVFNQFGGQSGALELDPHNAIHVMIGGQTGFMSDPALAGLDPIFWLHHCNVDRLWEAWLSTDGNIQETSSAWADGPMPRQFEMPLPNGQTFTFKPVQTINGGPLVPLYDDLSIGTGRPTLLVSSNQAQGVGGAMPADLSMVKEPQAVLIGANDESVVVGDGRSLTTIRLAPEATTISSEPQESRVLLNLENIRGLSPSGVLTVSLGASASGTTPASMPEIVKSVALFGLARASASDDVHGGNGISVAVDVTDMARQLLIDNRLGGSLVVHLQQPSARGSRNITVERVSIYRQSVG